MSIHKIELENLLKKVKNNSLSDYEINQLVNYYFKIKNPQNKCNIAIILSFIKNNNKIIAPIIDSLKYWGKTDYSGYALTTPAKIIVNYNKEAANKFIKLLNSKDKHIRFLAAGAWCFIILTEGVNNKRAWQIFNTQSKEVLKDYLLKESDQKSIKFILNFLVKNLDEVDDLEDYYKKLVSIDRNREIKIRAKNILKILKSNK